MGIWHLLQLFRGRRVCTLLRMKSRVAGSNNVPSLYPCPGMCVCRPPP